MCGFVGFWQKGEVNLHVLQKMTERLKHRGPDDMGIWIDKNAGLALGHRRLAIVDLSPAGKQPMISPCGRFVLVYNGEIYNHLDIRKELEKEGGAFAWKGHSDTETLLAALRHWGIEKTLHRLNGMFAFALWDRREKILFLARDRMGEKPLYYGHCGNTFLFASELKALYLHPDWQGEVDREALTLFLQYNYIPAPWSIYKGIKKLLPAHYIVVQNYGKDISPPICYWDLREIAEKGIQERNKISEEELIEELESLLKDAVKRRMMADVPLGAFLSGGVDSSTVVALMQAQSHHPVKTFSIGFYEEEFNEAPYAKTIAHHLGTDHTEQYVTASEAMAVIPELPRIWDEPFADSSQIPTFLVSKLARQKVTVVLSGDGGDELFYGYDRYPLAYKIWHTIGWIPLELRKALIFILDKIFVQLLYKTKSLPPQKFNNQITHWADRLSKLLEILKFRTGVNLYNYIISHWKNPEEIVIGGHLPSTIFNNLDQLPSLPDFRELMMWLDQVTYLPDDILVKVDRATMAVSLEGRIPLLDHRLVEFAWKVPLSMKYRNGQRKWLLRQVLYRYVPKQLMERPKMGFRVPIEHWLRGPLRDWAEALLNEKRLREEGFFNPRPIRKMWEEHLTGKRRWHYHLWDILMFQIWLEETKNYVRF